MLRSSLLGVLFAFGACATHSSPIEDRASDPAMRTEVQRVLATLGPGVRAAIWLSPPSGEPLFAKNVEAPMPVASAIKAGYLVLLFGERPAALDQALPEAGAVLDDSKHPAMAHFSAAQRATAKKALGSASVRRLGEAMITGKGVDNTTYNIAANLVTAHFGGPAWLEAKLHARDPEWQGLRVRRYMLASRAANGDNTATARSLAAVHARLAQGAVQGVDARAITAAREILARPADASGRRHWKKGGSLDSDPVTRVEAGFCEGPRGTLVHVVMLAEDGVPADQQAAAGQKLGAAALAIERLLLADAR